MDVQCPPAAFRSRDRVRTKIYLTQKRFRAPCENGPRLRYPAGSYLVEPPRGTRPFAGQGLGRI